MVGFVDLHSHLEAEHAFGGGWFWGTVEGPIDWAVRRCDGNFPFKTHAATMFPIVSEFLGADTGWHLGRRRGYDRRRCRYFFGIPIPGTCPRPHFEDWPMWDAIAHQQMWNGWLRQAHTGGCGSWCVPRGVGFLCSHTALGPGATTATRWPPCTARPRPPAPSPRATAVGWASPPRPPSPCPHRPGHAGPRPLLRGHQAVSDGDFIAQLDALRAQGIRSVQVAHHAATALPAPLPYPSSWRRRTSSSSLADIWAAGGILGLTDVTQINDIAAGTRPAAGPVT